MEHTYDEHIQKLLDAGEVPGEWNDDEEVKAYEALYRLLAHDIPVELPVNFISKVEAKIVAKRERALKAIFAVLICCFLIVAVLLFTSVYSSDDIINVVQALYKYKWVFLAALLVTGYVIISDYLKLKHSSSAFTRV